MHATLNERLALAGQINRIEFEEYPAVGAAWMKAVGLQELRKCVSEDTDRGLIDRYERGEARDVESRRAVIQLFLREWLSCNVPENIGVWGLEVDQFRPISRDEALRAADRIVAACQGGAEAGEQSPHAAARAYLARLRGRGRDGPAGSICSQRSSLSGPKDLPATPGSIVLPIKKAGLTLTIQADAGRDADFWEFIGSQRGRRC